MSSQLRKFPVRRRYVSLAALFVVALLAGLVALADALRPQAGEPGLPITAALDTDPREEVRCGTQPAREGMRPRVTGGSANVPVTSADLLDCPTTWDGRRVRFQGEVIGAILQRGDLAWLQVNDDSYALQDGPLPSHRQLRGSNSGIGVLVPMELLSRLGQPGGPGRSGDVIEVHGVYHRVDATTDEVAVIRADLLTVLQQGRTHDDDIGMALIVTAAVLGLIALLLLSAEWRLRRRWTR